MKKLGLAILLIILAFSFWPQILSVFSGVPSSCIDDFDSNKTGLIKNTLSINESKDKGVFVKALTANTRTIKLIGEISSLNLKNIWIEKAWSYECLDNGLTVVPKDFYHLLIATPDYETFVDHYLTAQGQRIELDNEIGGGDSGVIGFSLNELPSDTLTLTIYNKSNKVEKLVKLK